MAAAGHGRAVLVTGASRGIGAAVARAFAQRGDRVAIHYGASRNSAKERAASLPGEGHVVVQADLADPDAVRRMVDEAADGLGGLEVLVNNAGIFEPHPVTDTTYEEWQQGWERTLAINLTGAANVTWCAVQHMLSGGGGTIVNVSSRGAFRGEPDQPAYGASKAGLIAFGQSLARALGSAFGEHIAHLARHKQRPRTRVDIGTRRCRCRQARLWLSGRAPVDGPFGWTLPVS